MKARRAILLAIATLVALSVGACAPPEKAPNEASAEESGAAQTFEACSAEGAATAPTPQPTAQVDPQQVRARDLKVALPHDPHGAIAQAQQAKRAALAEAATPPANPVPAGPPPKITAPEPAFDYGTVAQGTVVKHTFTIRNEGEGPLKIERADGG